MLDKTWPGSEIPGRIRLKWFAPESRMAREFQRLVEQLKAVSHPLRLRVLALLEGGELCVCQVAESLQVPQSSVSEALRELRRVDFVTERKEGRWVFVSVARNLDTMPLLKGILAGASALPEMHADRAQAEQVRTLAISAVCSRAQDRRPAVPEAARA